VNHIGTSSVEMNVTGTSGGAVRVQATLTVVVAALKNHRSVPISADLRARLERYLVPPPA
jgi:acyl-CoA thioesterase FadM